MVEFQGKQISVEQKKKIKKEGGSTNVHVLAESDKGESLPLSFSAKYINIKDAALIKNTQNTVIRSR